MGSASVEPRRLKHKLVDFALRVNLSHDCRPRVGLGSPARPATTARVISNSN